jgi:mannan endo-1,4-beta-mannosidase
MIHLFTDEGKLNSYLEKVLKPMVAGLKIHNALAAYEIINEPVCSVKTGVKDANPCWDTQILTVSGADWAGGHLLARYLARFINHHAEAIKAADPKASITVGDGEQTSSTICGHKGREFWSDHCLVAAGGKPRGVIGMRLNTYFLSKVCGISRRRIAFI